FNVDQVKNLNPAAMTGFKADQMRNFDPAAMAGLDRNKVVNIPTEALEVLGIDQVRNMLPECKAGMGDKLESFQAIPTEVKLELVPQEDRRLGGVGDFSALLERISDPGSQESVTGDGWDEEIKVIEIEPLLPTVNILL
ncbi:MAG: hypothetical protein VW450_08575, partial [Chloroflexota bacterium]